MCLIFILCSLVEYIDFLWIRTDETIFGDNFINKLFGIMVLIIAIKLFEYTWENLGFVSKKFAKGCLIGLMLGVVAFIIAYGIEFLILAAQGLSPVFAVYVGGFSLTGNEIENTAFIFFAMCIIFNIINVVMEEGIFRGLFIKLGQEKYSFTKTNLTVALLFGIWHWIIPLRSYIDGDMTLATMLIMGGGYIILAGIMSIKWGLWLNITGFIWIGMAEHFFNNTIGNLLHVATSTGVDELQIVRILIAQLLSLAVVLVVRLVPSTPARKVSAETVK
jgi:membrane protease YdiL (CAAX protease family)